MDTKVKDQRDHLKRLKNEKKEARNELMSRLGKGSMRYKRTIIKLNKLGEKCARECNKKFGEKLDHLKKRHSEAMKQKQNIHEGIQTKVEGEVQGSHHL